MAARQSSRDKGANEAQLKMKVKELEEQVASYKQRLDELRKAKNTTILKKEREVLEVNAPQLGRRYMDQDARVVQLEKRLEESEKKREKDLEDLRNKFAAQMEKVKSEVIVKGSSDDLEAEIRRLKLKIATLEAENAALGVENVDLKSQIEELILDLSVKEARWCDTEEQLNLKLKMQWSEKYQEWMAETERKIEELQQANALLRRLVKKPQGSDPSGQDG